MLNFYDPEKTGEKHRPKNFRKDPVFEQLLLEVNSYLSECQDKINQNFTKPKFPLILIVGTPRSGTTLFLQWLAASGVWGFPSNLVSRFYASPYLGARIQQILIDYDYRQELTEFKKAENFTSSLGKTSGVNAPHEFWYFWRKFFSFHDDCDVVMDENLKKVDCNRLIAEMASLEAALNKPLALKAMLLNWHIGFLDEVFEKVIFVHIKRDPVFNMQSIIEGRLANFGTDTMWYSLKPLQYSWLKDQSPVNQVAGQVYFIRKAVENQLSKIDQGRKMIVDYDRFCEDPASVWKELGSKMEGFSYSIKYPYPGPDHFEKADKIRVSEDQWEAYRQAFQEIEDGQNTK